MKYAVQYTISVLTGAYAQKYSVIIYDAERLEGLLSSLSSPITGFAANEERREYDPFDVFQGLMKVLKKNARQTFCTAIIRTSENKEEASSAFCDSDEEGPFEVHAYGITGLCKRGNVIASFEEMTGKLGHYRVEKSTILEIFKAEIMNLCNLCEDAMAKGGQLIAQTVPNDTPAPEPLFQL